MLYIKAPDTYPYTLAQLKRDFPNTSFPEGHPPPETLADFGVFQVTPAAKPAFDPSLQACTEALPALVDGAWTQQWAITELSQEAKDAAAARAAQAQRVADHDQAIAQDAVVAQLKGMTVAEFDAWWTANVTTAAQAITILKRLARVVIRRVL